MDAAIIDGFMVQLDSHRHRTQTSYAKDLKESERRLQGNCKETARKLP
jgi:hypothetical protein